MDNCQSEALAASVQKTPHRVSLNSISDKIEAIEYLNPAICPHMTIALVRLKNGFVVIGESAPADPGNFDKDAGQNFAYDNAIKKIWPLEGYALRDRLAANGED